MWGNNRHGPWSQHRTIPSGIQLDDQTDGFTFAGFKEFGKFFFGKWPAIGFYVEQKVFAFERGFVNKNIIARQVEGRFDGPDFNVDGRLANAFLVVTVLFVALQVDPFVLIHLAIAADSQEVGERIFVTHQGGRLAMGIHIRIVVLLQKLEQSWIGCLFGGNGLMLGFGRNRQFHGRFLWLVAGPVGSDFCRL